MDSYLSIASKVLREMRQPLSAREILGVAYQLQIVPEDLYGKTQHKTLQARLSEDILHEKAKSEFIRTGPGRFFLRSLVRSSVIPQQYRKEYFAPPRAEQLRRFDVLCIPQDVMQAYAENDKTQATIARIPWQKTRYVKFSQIEHYPNLLHLHIMIIIIHDQEALIIKRSTHGSGQHDAIMSLGISGVIKREDKSLFAGDHFGLEEAAYRILIEHLRLPHRQVETLEPLFSSANVKCFWNVEGGIPNEVTAMLVYGSFDREGVIKCLEHINVEWKRLPLRLNDLDSFDASSRYILASDLLSEVTSHISE